MSNNIQKIAKNTVSKVDIEVERTLELPENTSDTTQSFEAKNTTAFKIDPLDPASLRIDPRAVADVDVKRALIHMPVRKPSRQEFFRVRAGQAYQNSMAIVELKEERETYAVAPAVASVMPGEVRLVQIRLCISRTGVCFLWPVPLPPADGRENAWHKTARSAAEIAEKNWTRLIPSMGAGCYDIFTAPSGMADPVWPEGSLTEMFKAAFGNGRFINSIEHPVIQRLLGC